MAMELSSLPLVLLLCLLAGSSTTALPALPGMDRVRQQVDRANRRGPSIGLVMSYVAEDTALQASGYFRPWRVQPFVDLYGRRFHIGSIRGANVIYALTGQRRVLKPELLHVHSCCYMEELLLIYKKKSRKITCRQ